MNPNTVSKPIIALTMGDPAGIGPEIIVKALASPQVQNTAYCIAVGSLSALLNACRQTGTDPAVLDSQFARVHDVPGIEAEHYEYGAVSAACGRAAYQYIETAIQLTLDGTAHAVATAPVNKESFKAGDVPFIGHTEIFGALTQTPDPLTLFEVRSLRIFFLSRHVPLRTACTFVTKERIIDYVTRCGSALYQLGITKGTMAVAGLNPHSGEHGLFGTEEETEIVPAIEELRRMGYAVAGPVGADSVFHQALQGTYNSVLSLYHDQGHIAAKTYDFDRTISITCGMPILRTSVDHGTAFDIAGKNKAGAVSMIEAICTAAKYAPHWNRAFPARGVR